MKKALRTQRKESKGPLHTEIYFIYEQLKIYFKYKKRMARRRVGRKTRIVRKRTVKTAKRSRRKMRTINRTLAGAALGGGVGLLVGGGRGALGGALIGGGIGALTR
jgi:outer membrane lipoprotein SlyB